VLFSQKYRMTRRRAKRTRIGRLRSAIVFIAKGLRTIDNMANFSSTKY